MFKIFKNNKVFEFNKETLKDIFIFFGILNENIEGLDCNLISNTIFNFDDLIKILQKKLCTKWVEQIVYKSL